MNYTKMLFIAPDTHIKRLIENELSGERILELLERTSLFGERRELVNLYDNSDARRVTISMADATHRVKSVYWEDMILFGEVEILPTLYHEYIKMDMEARDTGWFLPRLFVRRDEYDIIEYLCLITFDYSKPTFETADFAERCKNYLQKSNT